MPVRRRIDKRREDLTHEQESWLQSDDVGAAFYKYHDTYEQRALWDLHSERVISEHVIDHPGTRPMRYWELDAPEQRLRLGGTGTPASDVLAYVPMFAYGIPAIWVNASLIAYYSGRARDVHNQPIGYDSGRDFTDVAIDPDDPPMFESQATFLKRHKLLLAGEAKRSDFTPETVGNLDRHDKPPSMYST